MAKARARRPQGRTKKEADGNGAMLGFEQTLWQAADKLRNNLDAGTQVRRRTAQQIRILDVRRAAGRGHYWLSQREGTAPREDVP